MFVNRVLLSGKIIRGPYMQNYNWRGKEGPLVSFKILHNPTYRTMFRALKIWVKLFDKSAELVHRHVKYHDWVLCEGVLYRRHLKTWKALNQFGEPRPYIEVEMWAHTVDLMSRPWHDLDGGFIVKKDSPYVRIPRPDYERLMAFDEGRSRWEIPRNKPEDTLDIETVDGVLADETDPNPSEEADDLSGQQADSSLHDPGDEHGGGTLPGGDQE
jgi:hypothetical protein